MQRQGEHANFTEKDCSFWGSKPVFSCCDDCFIMIVIKTSLDVVEVNLIWPEMNEYHHNFS